MSDRSEIRVELVHAGPRRVLTREYRLAAPATVADALRVALADPELSEVKAGGAAVGIFGLVVTEAHALADGDRIEIYRPLAADPKSARRSRAREARRKR